MAWINTIDRPEPGTALARIYDDQKRQAGSVANILKIHSLEPAVLEAHLALYKAALHMPGELSRRQREMIAVTVSRVNRCEYWVQHHGAGLLRVSKDKTLVDALISGSKLEGLSARDQAMLAYAEKLTAAPHSITQADIAALRSQGYNDRAILEINLAAAYMNFVNRVASGLGVELEESLKGFTRWYRVHR